MTTYSMMACLFVFPLGHAIEKACDIRFNIPSRVELLTDPDHAPVSGSVLLLRPTPGHYGAQQFIIAILSFPLMKQIISSPHGHTGGQELAHIVI
ncbi:hypothetical protein EVAR_47994_1 [Eumeta japonica]|uniref:Secreted protein n=1 Tax=Eumeta variegata TaxID=151549 RepID=A0A4C1XID8_EUMVA|nr:hypothetical protein EVAR_47994_1 [Eumeta japonica]